MSKVVNKSQQVITAGFYPRSMYTRVVSVALAVPDDGVWYYVLTQVLGNKVWLLNVDVWLSPKVINPAQITIFDLYAGSVDPGTAIALREWDGIVPIYDRVRTRTFWIATDGSEHFHWTMSRYYKGESRRFGLAGQRPMGLGNEYMKASFEICEG